MQEKRTILLKKKGNDKQKRTDLRKKEGNKMKTDT
ncbi:MAG: outer membrane chaperone Skp [Prevotella sp.]|nr:MAG: outer membrane chaperone Skp [Prevotella sp.]